MGPVRLEICRPAVEAKADAGVKGGTSAEQSTAPAAVAAFPNRPGTRERSETVHLSLRRVDFTRPEPQRDHEPISEFDA